MTLSFSDARAAVLRHPYRQVGVESVSLQEALGRVAAADIVADRDYPALDRSVRDGYAVRAQDLPGPILVTATIRAGDPLASMNANEAVEIMTGAPIPLGADAVLMVEHAHREGDSVTHAAVSAGVFISRRGEEARAGQLLVPAGTRFDPSHVSMLASCGYTSIAVYRKPTVAILATGDELVAVDAAPAAHQVRNSNAHALAAQVVRAGGEPVMLGVARDDQNDTREHIREGLKCDLLILSGGVSAGRFDFVEGALASLGATFAFDRVKIQPGAPVVFGECGGVPFFGLPGNPVSTLVTFELFARGALELLGGQREPRMPISYGRLTDPFEHKPGLTRILPATLADGALTPVRWHGSSDIAAVARANAFLIADADRGNWNAGEFLPVLWK